MADVEFGLPPDVVPPGALLEPGDVPEDLKFGEEIPAPVER